MFSVIIPVYNRKYELMRLLNAIYRDYKNTGGFEVIIIDDKSNDGTYEFAEKFCGKNNFCKLITSGYRSPGISRNMGAKIAKYDWLILCDSDNIFESGWATELKKIITKYKEFEGIWFPAYSNGKPLTSTKYIYKGDHIIDPRFYYNNTIGEVVHCFRREFLLKHNYFYLKGHSNDFPQLLWFQMFTKYKVMFCNYKIQNYSTSSSNRISTEVSMKKVESQLVHYYLELNLMIKSKYKYTKHTIILLIKIFVFSLIINHESLMTQKKYLSNLYKFIRIYQIFGINSLIYKLYVVKKEA